MGVNISADHLVCDLSTFDSMAQRFGRVNRFGNCNDSTIDIVHPLEFDNKNDFQMRCEKTLTLLKLIGDNGNPTALNRLDMNARIAAFAPPPTILPVSEILFDAWALTSIRDRLPGRPPVACYLHGVSTWEPTKTTVAWREEVEVLQGDLLEIYSPEDLLEDYPLKPHETLADRSDRVFNALKKLNVDGKATPVWILQDDNSVTVTFLADVVEQGKDLLENKTLLLPPSAGGLQDGMLSGSSKTANDVADDWFEDKEQTVRRRIRVWGEVATKGQFRPIRKVILSPLDEEEEPKYWNWYELSKAGDGEGSKSGKKAVLWQVHTDDVVNNMKSYVARLPLPEDLKQAACMAARFHDLGKKRLLWQRSIGNPNSAILLAKSSSKMKGLDFTLYRHEVGSLLDSLNEKDFHHLDNEMKDLVLHLVAAHHGRARPHFPEKEVFDPELPCDGIGQITEAVPGRFAKMQRKYGRWGLAYLESLLRAADYAASSNPSKEMEEGP